MSDPSTVKLTAITKGITPTQRIWHSIRFDEGPPHVLAHVFGRTKYAKGRHARYVLAELIRLGYSLHIRDHFEPVSIAEHAELRDSAAEWNVLGEP